MNGSAQQRRSASIQRSNGTKKSNRPGQNVVTPQLGKRKRGSPQVQTAQEDGEVDELSPDRDEETVRSIEKSRRVVATASPVPGELDDMEDELSFMENAGSGVKVVGDASHFAHETPLPAAVKARVPSTGAQDRTPISDRIGNMSTVSRREIVRPARGSLSTEAPPITPVALVGRQMQQRQTSASRFGPQFATPHDVQDVGGSEDELSPPQLDPTPIQAKNKAPQPTTEQVEEVDELTPPNKAKEAILRPSRKRANQLPTAKDSTRDQKLDVTISSKRRRPRRVVEDDEDEEDVVQTTPAVSKRRRLKSKSLGMDAEEEEEIDEISPEVERTKRHQQKSLPVEVDAAIISSDEESHYEDQLEEGIEEETIQPIRRLIPVPRARSPAKKKPRIQPADGELPKKRQKRGPMQAIQVMRLKGFGVKGLTVVDTTRTVMEEWVTYRINRMTEKLATIQDPVRAKEVRQHRNVVLAYREKLDDILLDLQDANNSSIDNASKIQHLKRDNKRLLTEYLAIQRDRDQVALENDEITEAFKQEKKEVEDRHKLSASLYDIQAAIQAGMDKARKEGREDEGPEIPIKMLLDNVAKDVRSSSGLLSRVRNFNGVLDRTAGILEGRA